MEPIRSNYGTIKQTQDLDDNLFITDSKPKQISRISTLEMFVPKLIAYVPIVGDIVRPIFFKVIENLYSKAPDQDTKSRIFQIFKYYKEANQGFGTVYSIVTIFASAITLLFGATLLFISPILTVSVMGGAIALIVLAILTITKNGKLEQFEKNYFNEMGIKTY